MQQKCVFFASTSELKGTFTNAQGTGDSENLLNM